MACPHCGSWAVKADRSLAGRMVCGRCGRPLGRGAAAPADRGMLRRLGALRARPWLPMLALLIGVSAALAWLADGRQQPFHPPGRPPAGLDGNG
jgi:hypothetical protein